MSDSFKVVLLKNVEKRMPIPLYRGKPEPRRPMAREGRTYYAYEQHGRVYCWVRRGCKVELPEGSFERVDEQKKAPIEEAPN